MTLSERIISQALSGGWGAGEGFLARRRREREKKVEKRADLLARPDLLQKRVADVAQTLSLSTRKLRTRKYGSKLEALEAQTRGTPQEGFASELLAEYTAALEDPSYIDVTDRQLLARVAGGLMQVPDEEGKTRLEKAHRYKWRADTGLGNVFGLFGEDRSVRKLPGYEEWQAKEKAKPTDEWRTGPFEAMAWGGGVTAALMAGSAAIGRAGFAIPHPAAKIAGAALIAIPEFMAIDAVRNVLAKTEWARSREGSWKAYAPATIGIVGGGLGARKVITESIKKAAEKSVFSKGMTELLMKDPTAANAIRAGEAQKVAKAAQARVDRVMPKYISREDVLKSQFKTAEFYLEAVKEKARERMADIDVRTMAKATARAAEEAEARTEVAGMVRGLEMARGRKGKVAAMVRGLRTAAAKPEARAEAIGRLKEEAGELIGEVKTVSKTVDELLNRVQEAVGITKPVSRKKAAKIFSKELTDERTEAALKKAGKTGMMKEAVVEQKRVQELAKKQEGKVPEKSKITISEERARAKKKKKLEGDISKSVSKVVATEAKKMTTLYRAESPTTKFEDVFDVEKLAKFKPPKGIKGEFYTSEYSIAEYFKETYGRDAVIKSIKVPTEEAAKYRVSPNEYFVPKLSIKTEGVELIKERAEALRKAGLIKEAKLPEAAFKPEIEKEFEHISLEEAGLVEVAKGGVEESMGGFKTKTTRDLTELFKDAGKLFGVGVAAGAALLSPEEAEASALVKMGLKAGGRLIPKFKTTQEALLFGEKATTEQVAELKRLREVTTKEAKIALEGRDLQKASDLAVKGQLYREAFEAAEGAPYALKTLAEMKEGAAGEVIRKKALGAGITFFGSIPLANLFSPDSAEAAGLSQLGVKIPEMAASLLKKAPTRGKMLSLAKDMMDGGFLHVPLKEGAKEVKYVQGTISTAKLAVERNKNLVRNIKAETSPLGRWLTKKLSPYTTGDILYDINPMPEVGNLQSAIGNNVLNFLTATGNVLRDVPGLIKRETAGIIEKAMAPLAKEHSKNVIAYRAVEMKIEKLEKPLGKLYRALKKEGGAKHLPAIEKIEAKRASLLVARDELKPIFERFSKDWEGKVKELAPKHPATRVALACEDTAAYEKYPWLKPLMKPEEEEAVIWLKNIFESYKGRMAAAGHDVIEGPFCHHALHPDWLDKGAKEVLEGFGLDSKALPFTKFFRRAKYSKMMMPDINYIMQKYLLDAERRIQWSRFWGKGEKNSWYAHRRWVNAYGTEDQKMFWKRLSDAAIPPAPTKGNVAANIYSSFEVLRLLAFSPSVALKHYFKNIGTMSVMGAGNFASHLPEAVTTAIRGAKNSPEIKQIYKLIGVKGSKGKRKVFDEVADSFITQIHRMNMIADLDFEALIPHKAGFWKAFTEKMQGINRWGSIPVRMIESVDRHHTTLAAWEAAAKKGMTAQQAIYGIYSNILRLNFLSGACNPAWVRNPKIRAMLLFQNTAFKIMERRLMTGWKVGKDVKTAIGVIRHQDIGKTLEEMAGIGKYVLGIEREMKQNMIFDALTSTKGFFGTPVIKQAMTEAVLSGAIIMGGGIAGMNLWPQVWHLPFLRHGAKAPTLAVNPFLNAAFGVAGEREEAEEYGVEKDFMITAFMKHWLKSSGYIPQTANKMVRISKQDIPEIYKGSKWSYFFSVPAREEY